MLFGVLLVNVVVWYGGELCDLIMFWVGKTLHHGTNSLIECYIEVQSLKTFTTETWPQDISQTPACPAPRSPLGLSSRHPTLPFWGPLFHSLHSPFSFLILLSIPHHAEAYLCVLKSSLRGISVFDSAKELANFWKSGLAVGDFELS